MELDDSHQLCLSGDNGSGDVFGLWLPSRTLTTGAIVQTGQIFKPDGLALASLSLGALLLARTAHYLLMLDADPSALDALDLPEARRSLEPDDDTWQAILKWADPKETGHFGRSLRSAARS